MSPEVWIALIGIAGTLGGTLGGNALAAKSARQREDRQWTRQSRAARRLEILDAAEEVATLVLLVATGRPQDDEKILRSVSRFELRASKDVGLAARRLYATCSKVGKLAMNSEEYDNGLGEASIARDNFLETARKEAEHPTDL